MYQIIVYLHVASVFLFLMAHGVSAAVAFRMRSEQNVERVRGFLDLSTATYNVMYGSLGLLMLTGIIAGVMKEWWAQGWIWASLIILIVIVVAMSVIGLREYAPIRKAAGLPYFAAMKPQPPLPSESDAEIGARVAATRPWQSGAIGFVGLLLILWLMMFKPF